MTTQTEKIQNEFVDRQVKTTDKSLQKLEEQIADLDAKVDGLLSEYVFEPGPQPAKPEETMVWGVPFSRLTFGETLQHIDKLIASRQPGYFITANLNYNMLTDRHPELDEVNRNASFIVCDGMPMVWYSKLTGQPLPERIAGSELIYALSKWAAARGHRVFFLGGAPGIAQAAADQLTERYPGLQVVGVESPPYRPLSDQEKQDLLDRISESKPDIVFVALGQPKGEKWIAENYETIGAPVCVQIGASFDFVAGGVSRAPKWIQSIGMEWFYRMAQEPKRLVGRYFSNLLFLMKAVVRDMFGLGQRQTKRNVSKTEVAK